MQLLTAKPRLWRVWLLTLLTFWGLAVRPASAVNGNLELLQTSDLVEMAGYKYVFVSASAAYHCTEEGYDWSEDFGQCVIACGAHSYHTDVNTCTCNHGYYTTSGESSYTTIGGSCSMNYVATSCDNPTGTLQDYHCELGNLPAATDGYTSEVCLKDARDGKTYLVRKYADGKCWLANNLQYGKPSSSSDFATYAATTAYNVLGDGLYGVAVEAGDNYDGYLYNWQAVMQDASAYYNNTYTGEAGVQGLCPAGWHVPTGGASGEYQSLANAVQGSAVSDGCTSSDCATAYNFFRTASSNAWNATTKSMIAGAANSGSLNTQGTSSNWWSSTVDSTTDAYSLGLNASGIYPQNILDKYYGFSVRCV